MNSVFEKYFKQKMQDKEFAKEYHKERKKIKIEKEIRELGKRELGKRE